MIPLAKRKGKHEVEKQREIIEINIESELNNLYINKLY